MTTTIGLLDARPSDAETAAKIYVTFACMASSGARTELRAELAAELGLCERTVLRAAQRCDDFASLQARRLVGLRGLVRDALLAELRADIVQAHRRWLEDKGAMARLRQAVADHCGEAPLAEVEAAYDAFVPPAPEDHGAASAADYRAAVRAALVAQVRAARVRRARHAFGARVARRAST